MGIDINLNDIDKIDVWPLGVMLYRLVYSEYPYGVDFNDADFQSRFDEIINKKTRKLQFPEDKEIPPVFKDLLLCCLDSNIASRYSIFALRSHPAYLCYKEIINEIEKVYILNNAVFNLMTGFYNNKFEKVNLDSLKRYKRYVNNNKNQTELNNSSINESNKEDDI